MQHNSKSLPYIIGVSILFLVPLGAGGLIYSFFNEEVKQTEDIEHPASENNHFEELEAEKNFMVAPAPVNSRGTGTVDSESTGIPLGKYSNPPTSINSGGSAGATDPSLDSVDSDRLNRQNSLSPDDISPSSSDSLSRRDNNILDPLDEDYLKIPDSKVKPATTPTTEPLLQGF